MNEAVLDSESSKPGTLKDARRALIELRIDAERLAQPIIAELATVEQEIRKIYAEDTELVQRHVFEGTKGLLGDALAKRCSYIAPSVIAEQEFQGRNPVSPWAESMRRLFSHASDFDGRNVAQIIARQAPSALTAALVARQHSEELRARLNGNVAT